MFVPTAFAIPSLAEPSALLATPAGAYGLTTLDDGSGDTPEKKLGNWSSLIGIVTAIVGNVLIALALNVQRYAHIQLHRRRAQVRERARQAIKDAASKNVKANGTHNGSRTGGSGGGGGGYGTVDLGMNSGDEAHREESRLLSDGDARESDPLRPSHADAGGEDEDDEDDDDVHVASTYLKSPLWWLGQVLITVGEMGNFLAYGFAPASIVSPLGVVALISNCVIAPFLFKEVFRQRDFWGVIVAIAGAVTVVLSAKQQETKLEPHDVWDAITTMEFEIYLAVTCSLIGLLMWASPRYGNRTILIDLGLVGLFGGYTVLATKGVSSMLSSTLFRAFTTPVTYALVLVLLGTAILQVRYVNKALQRFDSTQVIPIQFVLFTLSVIIGSAVLYRDFERTSEEQATKFVGGCLLTFFGVFLITSGREAADDDEEHLDDEEGIEETIGLSEHGPAAAVLPQTPQQQASRRGSDAARSRRSSRASRVSFLDAVNKPLTVLAETGVPSLRVPAPPSNSRAFLSHDGLGDGSPVQDNPWRDSVPSTPSPRPGMTPPALSSESVPSISSVTQVLGMSPPQAASPGLAGPCSMTAQLPVEAPITPRGSVAATTSAHLSSSRPHSHHFAAPLYSPSPLSSTVSAVVADTLLRHVDSASSSSVRRLSVRRSRPGLRNSLFVPQDELEAPYGLGIDADAASVRGSGGAAPYQSDTALALAPGDASPAGAGAGGSGAGERDQLLGVPGGTKKNLRTRARSLSNALGDLFSSRKKQRRGTSAGTESSTPDERDPGTSSGPGETGGTPVPPPGARPAAASSSAVSLESS